MQDNVYPHVIISAEYGDELIVNEKIVLPRQHIELSLRKPENLSYLKIEDTQKIVEDEKNIHVFLNENKREVKLQYTINTKNSLLTEWIIAPKECYTLDATIITPIPFKSIINSMIYGFHAWGKYGYSRWVNPMPRRKYILSIDYYFIIDKRNYIVASTSEDLVYDFIDLVNSIYSKTKEILPWKRPIVIYNSKIVNRVSTNILFAKEPSYTHVLELLIQSLVNDLDGFPRINRLIDTVNSLINNRIDYEKNRENPYMGLAKFYGENIIRAILEKTLTACPNNIIDLVKTVFGDQVSSIISSLLQRGECQITLYDNKIKCDKGPCVIVLSRNDMEFLKAILAEGEELVLSVGQSNRIKALVF